ncbi:hypothetical protein Q7C36_001476 [Tachysurus vachellii]|uniref:Uncharacterized protein n=1 Tax=Tachysurus vachellii TaxID=175792 RepID=A0AA88P3W1_TACVA|nr:hypothetical protein Q7C36_001476 [Tachysurus vachellii]
MNHKLLWSATVTGNDIIVTKTISKNARGALTAQLGFRSCIWTRDTSICRSASCDEVLKSMVIGGSGIATALTSGLEVIPDLGKKEGLSKNFPQLEVHKPPPTQIMQVVRSRLMSEQSSVHALSEVQVISITAESAVHRLGGQRVIIGEQVSSSQFHEEFLLPPFASLCLAMPHLLLLEETVFNTTSHFTCNSLTDSKLYL